MHRKLDIEEGMVVQITLYGVDYQIVPDSLANLRPTYRGCADTLVFGERETARSPSWTPWE